MFQGEYNKKVIVVWLPSTWSSGERDRARNTARYAWKTNRIWWSGTDVTGANLMRNFLGITQKRMEQIMTSQYVDARQQKKRTSSKTIIL